MRDGSDPTGAIAQEKQLDETRKRLKCTPRQSSDFRAANNENQPEPLGPPRFVSRHRP